MIKPVSRTESINEQLRSEHKIVSLNAPEHTEAIVAMTEAMEDVRREYRTKDHKSQISAANVVLTA